MTDTRPQKLSEEQEKLDNRLIDAAAGGDVTTVKALLASGANVHAGDDHALRLAAYWGHAETVTALLAAGADVHADNDKALFYAARDGHAETVKVMAKHIFAPDAWRGKNRAQIEAYATTLYNKIKAGTLQPERLLTAAKILADCALTCWEQVRPAPPKIKISPLPAQPRAL